MLNRRLIWQSRHTGSKVNAKHRRKGSQDAGELGNLDPLLPIAKMFAGSKAGSKAAEAEAAPDGVPDQPCSAGNGGACQRHCDEAGTLSQREPADLIGPQWKRVVPAPGPAHHLFGDPVQLQRPCHHPASRWQHPLFDRISSQARRANFADRLKISEVSKVVSSVAHELELRQGNSQQPQDLCATEPHRYGAFHVDRSIAGLSETDRAGSKRGTYKCSVRNGLLAPRIGCSARRALPIKRKALLSDRQQTQGNLLRQRRSLGRQPLPSATVEGRGWCPSKAVLQRGHHGVLPGTHVFGSSRAAGPREDRHDLGPPLSGDSTSSAAQGSETVFDTAGPMWLPRSTAGTVGVVGMSNAPAMVAAISVANSPWHNSGKGKAGELLIEVRPRFGHAPEFFDLSDPTSCIVRFGTSRWCIAIL
jgi:hypothetical protein